MERLALAGDEALRIEDESDLGVGMLLHERVDLVDYFWPGLSKLPGIGRSWEHDGSSGPAAETDVERQIVSLSQRYVLDQESEDTLFLPMRSL